MRTATTPLKSLYHVFLSVLPKKLAIYLHFRIRTGYWPNFDKPRSFNEFVQNRKINGDHALYARLADKVLVKDYVRDTIGERYLIPTIWSGRELPPAPDRDWPVPCVVKVNHGSGGNIFARQSNTLRSSSFEATIRKWMKKKFSPHLKEDFYDLIDRKILVEPLIGEELLDYKFYVFNGFVEFIHVDSNRFTDHQRAFFDREWKKMPFGVKFPSNPDKVPPPLHLDEMICAAEKLGHGIDFVRIDFYDLPSGPLFGEMTFTPGGGCEPFRPASFDFVLGEFWAGTRGLAAGNH